MRQTTPFGKYLLLERISVGGMAEVFKAKQFGAEGFEKMLAIKRILPSMAQDSEFISMFIDEAKICGQLNHGNVCQIYELGRVAESHFIAMEFVWGKDLLQIQNRFRKTRQTMRPEMAAFIAARMCDGLDHAHKKKDPTGKPLGIIHRDISPQNVLVGYDGEVKIIDFGIAKAASRSSKTQAGVLKGKFGYMSPEQVRGLPLDRRSDVFAIGTLLYEMLVADRLFIGDSDFETLEKVRNVDIPPPSKVNPDVPTALEQIIMRALKKDVEDRYQWGSEMLADLETFLMRFDPPFSVKNVAQWMRDNFTADMKREGDVLEQQKKIGKEAMTAAPAPAASPLHAPMGEDMPSGGTQVLADSDIDVIEGNNHEMSTQIVQPGQIAGMPGMAGHGAGDLQAGSTMILQPGMAVPTPIKPATSEPKPLPAESTMILQPGMEAPRPAGGPMRVAPNAATMLEMAAPVIPASVMLAAQAQPMPAPVVATPAPVARAPLPTPGMRGGRRSSLWKDVAIGVMVAVGLVGGVLGVRAMLRGKSTLVVTANPPRACDVYIDKQKRGHLEEGLTLTLKELSPGPHLIEVRASDGSGEFRSNANLPSGDLAVLTATLKPAVASAPVEKPTVQAVRPAVASAKGGQLRIKLEAEGAHVFVDGREVPEAQWRAGPLPLDADVAHDVKITKPAREDVKFNLTLKAGELVEREIDLLPAYGHVKVVSDPPGAEVNVNGRRYGTAPVDANDIDPSKTARVTLRMKGFAQVIKYASFDKGLEQTLEVKLTPSSDDGFGGKEPVAEVEKKPEKKALPKLPVEDKGAAAAGAEPGFLIANTQPWAKVIIDGKDTGKMTPIAPRSKISLKPGKHVVTFVADGKKFNFDIIVKAGEDVRLMKQLSDAE